MSVVHYGPLRKAVKTQQCSTAGNNGDRFYKWSLASRLQLSPKTVLEKNIVSDV